MTAPRWLFLCGLLMALSGCPASRTIEFTVTLNPYGKTPLAAEAVLVTDRPVTVKRIEIEGGWSSDYPGGEASTRQEIMVVGFRPATVHKVRLHYQTADGKLGTTEPRQVETPPLPPGFPVITAEKFVPDQRLEGGFMMLSLSPLVQAEPLAQTGLAILLDKDGKVIWFLKTDSSIGAMERRANGNFLIQKLKQLRHDEVDWLGRTVRSWQATGIRTLGEKQIAVKVETLHHDLQELQGDRFCSLASHLGEDKRVDEKIVTYALDGRVESQLSLIELLDPEREIHARFPNYYEFFYGRGVTDWGHANSLVVDEQERTALVSLAYQDAIVKVDLAQQKLLWILGRPEGWKEPFESSRLKAMGDLSWPTKQHAATPTKTGTILCFDNGESQSRAVEYRVDEKNKQVEQVWEFTDEEPFFSNLLGDVRELKRTGNIQITDGTRVVDFVRRWARVVEVSHENPPEKLMELTFRRPQHLGCSIYRCERLDSLY